MSDEIEKPDEDVTETAASTEAAASETEAKPKPARKPRAAKAKADDEAAEAAPAEEKPKPARKPRAAKPKAEEAAAEAPTAEKPAAAKATPKRSASRQPEPAPRRAKHPEPVSAQVVRAQAKYVRSSARKARLVCDNIRGKSVTDARAILAHTPRAVARDWSKLLESAIANAENNHDLDGEDLVIKSVTADEGPTIKRFRPRAMGRATQIRKRTSHLTILLTPKN
jgi:ribosomal protein L22